MIARLSMTALFLASLCLVGCGKAGTLEQPPPLFGDQAKADYAAQRHADEAARARADAARNPPPQGYEPDPNPLPLQQAPYHDPIPGRDNQYGPNGPPGALPQPGEPAANQ